jgi:hypothetical protein
MTSAVAAILLLAQDASALLRKLEAAAEDAASLKIEGSGPFGAFKGAGTAALTPTKRTVAYRAGKRSGEYVETYPEWTSGADVPDATFTLVPPKAP